MAVDRSIARAQPHVVRSKVPAQCHPLLVDQRLDRRGVHGAPPLGQRLEVQPRGHQRFPRSRGGIEDDVPAGVQLENGLLLGRVERQFVTFDEIEEELQQGLVIQDLALREKFCQVQRHGPHQLPGRHGSTVILQAGLCMWGSLLKRDSCSGWLWVSTRHSPACC